MDFLDLHKQVIKNDMIITSITLIAESKKQGYKVEVTVRPKKLFRKGFTPNITHVFEDDFNNG